jgi:ribose transport system substrate-binding protein
LQRLETTVLDKSGPEQVVTRRGEREMKHRNRLAIAASLVAVLALLVSACGGDDDEENGSGDGDATAQLRETLDCDRTLTPEEVVDYQAPEPNEDYDITLMEVSLAGYYYQAIKEGAEELVPPGVSVTTVAGKGYVSPEQQISQIEDAIQRGTDAIVLAPSDIEGSVPVVELARDADIPVVNISTEVNSEDVHMVMQDDYVLGQQLADRLADTVGAEGGTGILIAGPDNATWSRKRTQGFTDRINEEYPEIQIAAAPTQLVDPAEGLASFEDAVQANPDLDWIASVHYFILLPSSVPSKYRGKVPYVSFGYEPDSVTALEAGELNSVYGIAPVAMGEIGVGTAISVLNGEDVPRVTCVPSSLFTVEEIGTPVANAELAPSSQ